MNVLQSSKLFMKRNASTILTCIGGVGVIATSATAVKATPKALRILEQVEQEKGEKLTKLEIVKAAAPVYIPSILIGASTIACIFGANALNQRQQAALMSAYALLDNSYKEYKEKVNELYGEDADKNVREGLAKDKYETGKYPLEGDKVLFYDEYSKEYFETTMEKVLKAEYLLNRDFAYHGYACLNELYALLGLPQTPYGDILGWSTDTVHEHQWYTWIDFNHTKVTMDDGLECYILEILTEPIPDFEYDYWTSARG